MARFPFQFQKQHIILGVGILMFVGAGIVLVGYVQQLTQKISQDEKARFKKIQANQASVLIALKDIPKGVTVEPEFFEVKIIPNNYVQPGAVTSIDRIAGMVTVAPIQREEQITLSKLTQGGNVGDLSSKTPSGKRAISVTVENIYALAGMIKAGDYVDVLAVMQLPVQTADGKTAAQIAVMPLFQNILVLAVGQDTGAGAASSGLGRLKKAVAKAAEVSPIITLALTPQEAGLISFVQEQGRIRLMMRSPADSKIEPVQTASWDTFFQYVMPRQPVEVREEPKPKGTVEIYRGLNKEKLQLYK